MATEQITTASLVERQVLDVVAQLVSELDRAHAPAPMLDDSLDRDLGISSLERVELLLDSSAHSASDYLTRSWRKQPHRRIW